MDTPARLRFGHGDQYQESAQDHRRRQALFLGHRGGRRALVRFHITIASADHGDDFYVAFDLDKRNGGFAVTKTRFQPSLGARRKIDVPDETLPAAVGPKHVAALIRWARAAVAAASRA
jgi:hypothetical protein